MTKHGLSLVEKTFPVPINKTFMWIPFWQIHSGDQFLFPNEVFFRVLNLNFCYDGIHSFEVVVQIGGDIEITWCIANCQCRMECWLPVLKQLIIFSQFRQSFFVPFVKPPIKCGQVRWKWCQETKNIGVEIKTAMQKISAHLKLKLNSVKFGSDRFSVRNESEITFYIVYSKRDVGIQVPAVSVAQSADISCLMWRRAFDVSSSNVSIAT